MNKKCGNCGKYPFCKKTNGAAGYCEEWIKRNKSLLEKYCKKIHIPFNENIENTLGFTLYKLRYQAFKLAKSIIGGK